MGRVCAAAPFTRGQRVIAARCQAENVYINLAGCLEGVLSALLRVSQWSR